jgi:hypothetical protein
MDKKRWSAFTLAAKKPIDILATDSATKVETTDDEIPGLRSAGITASSFHWETIQHGACTMTDAAMVLFSNGTAWFTSLVQSPDPGDVWLVNSIALLDNNGVELYGIPKFDGPTMTVPNELYEFQTYLSFPMYLFPYVTALRMYHHC